MNHTAVGSVISESRKFAVCLTIVFLILEAVLITHHEMWRDELQPWIIARNSSSLIMMLKNLAGEVHPGLWYMMLYGVSRFTGSPSGMQLIHWLIAGAIVYVFSRYAPFTRIQKILFPFGYLILYEYATISRSYSTGVLLIFISCVFFKNRYKRFITIAVVLFLLANTSVIGCTISGAVGAALMVECLGIRKKKRVASSGKLIAGFCLISLGCVIGAAQCVTVYEPQAVSRIRMSFLVDRELIETFSTVAYGILPLPQWTLHFWDSNILAYFPPAIPVAIGLILFSYLSLFLRGERIAQRVYVFSTLGMLLFYYLSEGAFCRHYGYHYIMILASLWIYLKESDGESISMRSQEPHKSGMSFMNKLITRILLLHVLCSIYPFYAELTYPFSTGRQTADWIRSSDKHDWLIAGYPHAALTSVAGYLDTTIYALAFEKFLAFPNRPVGGSFGENISLREALMQVPELEECYGSKILFIFNKPIDEFLREQYGLTEMAGFEGSICNSEQFHVYGKKGD